MAALSPPVSEDDLYLYRGTEVAPGRPIFQGDVFADAERQSLSMLVSHPCSMRQGVQLRSRLTIVEIIPYQMVDPDEWATSYFDIMPLPGLLRDDQPRAANFRAISTAKTSDLASLDRIACLSEDGIQLLQQRFAYHLTRVAIPLRDLYEQSAPIIVEAELQEDWVTASGEPTEAVEAAFQDFLGHGEGSLRAALEVPNTRARVRRAVREEIARRFG